MQRFRIFTLEEANRLLGDVSEHTARTRARLDVLRESYKGGDDAEVEAKIRETLDEWARAIMRLGAQPKGIFTVDFRSPDPNVLWCWAPGEGTISHRHFSWETFRDRVTLGPGPGTWPFCN